MAEEKNLGKKNKGAKRKNVEETQPERKETCSSNSILCTHSFDEILIRCKQSGTYTFNTIIFIHRLVIM